MEPHELSTNKSAPHWLNMAARSLALGTLCYAGVLFPFAVTDGLLGLDCHGWVKGSRGSASLLFVFGWGCSIAIMAGRLFGRTENIEDLLRSIRLRPTSPTAQPAEAEVTTGPESEKQ